jgi:hypothetical protein
MSELEVSKNNSKKKERKILKKSLNITKKVISILNLLNVVTSDFKQKKNVGDDKEKESSGFKDFLMKASIKDNSLHFEGSMINLPTKDVCLSLEWDCQKVNLEVLMGDTTVDPIVDPIVDPTVDLIMSEWNR